MENESYMQEMAEGECSEAAAAAVPKNKTPDHKIRPPFSR
jgi:hypothetical protein